jgi:predicted CXXCH cytochrome family protein
MQVEVSILMRRGPDAIMRRSHSVTGEVIRFGRGSDNEVQLSDIRLGLHAAALTLREAGLFIERAGEEPMRVNGASTINTTLKSGDKIHLGPYEITIADPPAGFDAAVTVEMVQPMGDALERLMAQSRIGLDRVMSKRAWAWALFLIFAVCGLILPLALYPFGHVVTSARSVPPPGPTSYVGVTWNPGDVANPHRFFALECSTCHQAAFSSVSDQACLSCHQTVGSHLERDADVGTPPRKELDETRCATCHVEHRGVRSLVIQSQALCVDCHETLAQAAPKSGVQSVTGFPAGHPQFRATVVADAAAKPPTFARAPLGSAPPPQDKSNLVFSHAAHLVPAGFLVADGSKKIMVCADCHVAEPSGQGFQPVTFEGQCHSCHDLKFDAALPWREVPHGDAAGVALAVTDFYGHMALQGGVQDAAAPDFVRRPVGQPVEPTPDQAKTALAWAAQRASAAMDIIWDPKRGCSYCHVTGQGGDKFTVAPVVLRQRFLPHASFDHARHRALTCADCHDAGHSEKSSDVLLPGIETCVSCHGTERADFKTQSTCTSCHLFHRQEFGPMKTASVGK